MSRILLILCYGRDSILVKTRQQIFERAGFTSKATLNLPEVKLYLEDYEVDVLVICHSVSTEDCEDAKRTAHDQ